MTPRRSRRRHKATGKRKEVIKQQKNNNFLIVLLSLIVLFETMLLLFLIPRKPLTETVTRAPKKEARVLPKEVIPKKPSKKIVPIRIRGKIAIVIDDWGYNTNNLYMLEEIEYPLTLAILPFRNYSRKIAEFGHSHNFEIIIHMPMEPDGRDNLGLEPRTLMTSMGDEIVKMILNDAYNNIPYAKGMNNHMGSLATQDERFVSIIFNELKRNNLYFLDSFVVSNSVCKEVSRDVGIKFAKRSIFLDNKSNSEYIRGQLMELVAEVDKTGSAIGIGHDKRNTLEILREVMPQLAKNGYKFVFLSEVVE